MASTSTLTPQPDYQVQAAAPPWHHRSRSLGPFFGVMTVILILTVFSCIFGRVCASQAVAADASYDCVGWTRWRWRRFTMCRSVASEAKAVAKPELPPALPQP